MIGAYGAGEILRLLFSADPAERGDAAGQARGYFLSGLACLAASLVNPYTYHLHVHMVAVSARSVEFAAHRGISFAEFPSSDSDLSSK